MSQTEQSNIKSVLTSYFKIETFTNQQLSEVTNILYQLLLEDCLCELIEETFERQFCNEYKVPINQIQNDFSMLPFLCIDLFFNKYENNLLRNIAETEKEQIEKIKYLKYELFVLGMYEQSLYSERISGRKTPREKRSLLTKKYGSNYEHWKADKFLYHLVPINNKSNKINVEIPKNYVDLYSFYFFGGGTKFFPSELKNEVEKMHKLNQNKGIKYTNANDIADFLINYLTCLNSHINNMDSYYFDTFAKIFEDSEIPALNKRYNIGRRIFLNKIRYALTEKYIEGVHDFTNYMFILKPVISETKTPLYGKNVFCSILRQVQNIFNEKMFLSKIFLIHFVYVNYGAVYEQNIRNFIYEFNSIYESIKLDVLKNLNGKLPKDKIEILLSLFQENKISNAIFNKFVIHPLQEISSEKVNKYKGLDIERLKKQIQPLCPVGKVNNTEILIDLIKNN